jgi:hypothetical protein
MHRKQPKGKQPATAVPSKPIPATPRHNGAAAGTPSPDEIRLRAYLLWESAGKPSGNEGGFWLQAEHELTSNP